jgi:hypothetical protein
MFSNTLGPWSSLNMRDQVLHPYKTTGRIMVMMSEIINLSEISDSHGCEYEVQSLLGYTAV